MVPKVRIDVPFAAWRVPDARRKREAGEAGNTEMSAPESMRKGRRRRRQKSDRDPEEEMALTEGIMPGEGEGVIVSRHARFPETSVEVRLGPDLDEDGLKSFMWQEDGSPQR